jgi:hypothetical protein
VSYANPSKMSYSDRIKRMASDGGVSILEVAAEFDWDSSQASSKIGDMCRKNQLVKAIPPGFSRARYYLSPPLGSLVEDVAQAEEVQTSVAASTPPWKHHAQTRQERRNGVTVTIGPSTAHDPRFQCAPDERVEGAGFVKAGIGRYL